MTTPEEARLAAEGWIKHDGKGMPVGYLTTVEVARRDWGQSGPATAMSFYWGRNGSSTITHYRVVTPATEPAPVPADTLTIRDQIALDAPIPITVAHEWYLKWGRETDRAIDFMSYWAERRYAYADAMLAERALK